MACLISCQQCINVPYPVPGFGLLHFPCQSDSCIREPDNMAGASVRPDVRAIRPLLVVSNGLSPKELHTISDGVVVTVALWYILVASSKVGCDETHAGVMVVQSNSNTTFVAGHPTQSGLWCTSINISTLDADAHFVSSTLNISYKRRELRFHQNDKHRPNQLHR